MSTFDKRKRRKAGDLLPVLIARKNEFADWAYAGRPESMLAVFPELEKDLIELKIIRERKAGILTDATQEDRLRNDSKYRTAVLDEYFAQISAAVFNDAKVAKCFGVNLKRLRERQKYTLKSVSEVLKIEYQNLDEIEKGRRKKIDRDLLVLFCGIYHTCPETLLGIQRISRETPMDFVASTTGQKAHYIIHRLFPDAPLLLLALMEIGRLSPQKQRQFVETAELDFGIKIFTENQIANKLDLLKELDLINKPPSQYLNLTACCDDLYDLELKNSDLMNFFVSIAANQKENFQNILSRLINLSFLSIQ